MSYTLTITIQLPDMLDEQAAKEVMEKTRSAAESAANREVEFWTPGVEARATVMVNAQPSPKEESK